MGKHKRAQLTLGQSYAYCTRAENVVFDFKEMPFDKLTPKKREMLKQLNISVPEWLVKGDGYRLHYTFKIEYINGIEEKLALIEQLLNNGFILEVISKELNYTKCLMQDIFIRIERIEKKYKKGGEHG